MRSRYVAFTRGDWEYLKKTWHPETLPEDLGDDEPSQWVGLKVIQASEDDDEGEVEFEARLIYDDKLEILHEISDFEKINGAWLYHSGEFLNDDKPVKISRGQPCPCGSNKTYAQCHGRR
jgi:SEC-C motif-containing protein